MIQRLALLAALAAAIFLSSIAQSLLPSLDSLWGAKVQLIPIFFCLGALALPFPMMLILAVLSGLVSDLSNFAMVDGSVEIAIGWSIVPYVIFGALLQGFRPAFVKGRWDLHAFASAILVVAMQALQFAMLTMRRMDTGGLFFNDTVLWRILVPGSIAFLLSPIIYFLVKSLGGFPTRRRLIY